MNKILLFVATISQIVIISFLFVINEQLQTEITDYTEITVHGEIAVQSSNDTSNKFLTTECLITNIRVVDADTLEGDINLPLNIVISKVMIRFDDFDAWESNKRRRSVVVTDEEVVLGKLATKFFIELLEDHKLTMQFDGNDRDMYGRILATPIVYTPSGDKLRLKKLMKENDFIRDDRFVIQ